MRPGLLAVSGGTLLSQAPVLTVLAVIMVMCMSRPEAFAADGDGWRFLTRDTPYSIRYYEREPASGGSQGLPRAWTKTVPSAEGNPQIREIRSLWEFDCGKRAFRNLKTVIAYRDGSSEETETPRDWTEARPGIWVGRLAKILCAEEPGADENNKPKGTPPR